MINHADPIEKDRIARELANFHAAQEDSVRQIFRLVSQNEDADSEPVKLLEINTQTIPSGVIPVYFGPSSDVPIASVVIEISAEEFEQIRENQLKLPHGWCQGEKLFERS